MAQDKCRSQALLEYFGEPDSPACGECDVCRIKSETVLRQEEFNLIRDEILAVLAHGTAFTGRLIERVPVHRDKMIRGTAMVAGQ